VADLPKQPKRAMERVCKENRIYVWLAYCWPIKAVRLWARAGHGQELRNPPTNKRTLMVVHRSEQKFVPSNHLYKKAWPVENRQSCMYASWPDSCSV